MFGVNMTSLGLLMCFLLLNVYIIKINLYFNAEERHLLLVKCEASIISVHATYFICISSTGISYKIQLFVHLHCLHFLFQNIRNSNIYNYLIINIISILPYMHHKHFIIAVMNDNIYVLLVVNTIPSFLIHDLSSGL
jgi:hypothetical protein